MQRAKGVPFSASWETCEYATDDVPKTAAAFLTALRYGRMGEGFWSLVALPLLRHVLAIKHVERPRCGRRRSGQDDYLGTSVCRMAATEEPLAAVHCC